MEGTLIAGLQAGDERLGDFLLFAVCHGKGIGGGDHTIYPAVESGVFSNSARSASCFNQFAQLVQVLGAGVAD